jgi:hypothetical protein
MSEMCALRYCTHFHATFFSIPEDDVLSSSLQIGPTHTLPSGTVLPASVSFTYITVMHHNRCPHCSNGVGDPCVARLSSSVNINWEGVGPMSQL